MEKEKAKKRLEKLRKEIDYHRYQYHVLDNESINPSVLDSLKKELYDIENKYPDLITTDSPSQRVAGKALDKFKKVSHYTKMTSLNDVFSLDDLIAWEKRNLRILQKENFSSSFKYWSEYKLDGLAVSILYNQASFERGATRGDGMVGEDISSNLKTIKSIPLNLNIPDISSLLDIGFNKIVAEKLISILSEKRIEIRGEAVMPISVLKEINEKNRKNDKPLLANTRNGAAGSLRQLNPKIAAERKLSFFAFYLILNDLRVDELIDTRDKAQKLISLLGFKISEDSKLFSNLIEIKKWHEKVKEKRATLDFEIDGTVIKINEHKFWPILGIVGKAPRYMIAYKFPAEQVSTKLVNVEWQVGRSGALTPLAIFEAVKVGGARVSRASLHNFDEINRLGLKISDTVIVERAGDVIPKVVKVLKGLRDGEEKEILAPKSCPRCGGDVKRDENMSAYRCLNKHCHEITLRRLIHFVSKPAFDIEGLGENIILLLFNKNLIKTADDIFRLRKEDLLKLEGFKEKKIKNLLEAIEKKKKIELSRFLKALSISQIGEVSAYKISEILSKEINNKTLRPSELLNWAKDKNLDYWLNIEDIGDIVAKSLVDFWDDNNTKELLTKLELEGVELILDNNNIDSKFNKQTFVLTGKLNSLTRQEAKDKIRRVGGLVKDQVTKDLDYLIVGDDPGSKFDKAKKLKLTILNEEEFLNKIV